MALAAGTSLGAYDTIALLGSGGMGEVYRARDTKLDRDVAIKILPPDLENDPDRIARFLREAKTLAALNHPNIAQIYGLEAHARLPGPTGETGSPSFIIMELVEGPTLADRLATGAIPLDQAIPIARQIADALEAAHDQGIVHRDLKPANIKVTPTGRVKVLDFGLAKMAASDSGVQVSPAITASPTITTPRLMTGVGVILGTAAYMSPEQARGKPADRRSDIWAYGCVLFEMFVGSQVFGGGETVSDAIAAILTRDPDWSLLPADLPSPLRTLLRRCLERDPDRRLHHIADARLDLDDAVQKRAELSAPAQTRIARPTSRVMQALPWAVAALALIAAVASWSRGGRTGEASREPIRRLELNLPAGVELFNGTRTIAIASDGSKVAFVAVAAGTRQIYVRSLDRFDAVAVRGTETTTECTFSPDGTSLAFVTAAGVLKTVSLTDGLTTTVTDDANTAYGVAWTPADDLVFVRGGTLWQVARGGAPRQLTTLGGSRQDTIHGWPAALPTGTAVLFGAASGSQWRVESVDLVTGARHLVVERATLPLYASGHITFFRDEVVLAAPFDSARVALTGPPVPLIERLPAFYQGVPVLASSWSGAVIYSPSIAVSRLEWVSRDGLAQPANDVLRPYATPQLAVDGSHVLVQAGDLWIQDLARASFTRVADDIIVAGFPIWTPDGHRVVYRGSGGLRVRNADGSGPAEMLRGTLDYDFPGAMTPDGETLVVLRSTPETSFDIYALSIRDGQMRPIVKTAAYEGGSRLSPDGRWLAYVSNESGQYEIYLRPFPGPDRRWQISAKGGTQPVWNPNGKEIFYRDGNKMMAVGLSTVPDVVLTAPRLLFEQRYAFGTGVTLPNYDVSRDGQRFLMVKDESTANQLNLVLNAFADAAPGASHLP